MEWVTTPLGRLLWCRTPDELPDELLGDVFTGVFRGSDPNNAVSIEFVHCSCREKPDGRKRGARLLAEHYAKCDDVQRLVRDHIARQRTPKQYRARLFVRPTGTRPEPRQDLSVDDNGARHFLERHTGRPIEVRGQVVTICGTTPADMPERPMRALMPMAIFVRNDEPRAVMGLGLSPTHAPRAALQRYLDGASDDLVARRSVIEADARRDGCAIVYGFVGQPVRQPAPDLRDEVAKLQARLADLESRASA